MFKPSNDVEILLVSISKKLENFRFELFVGDVTV